MGLLPQFDIRKSDKASDKAKIAKASQKQTTKVSKSNTLLDKLTVIKLEVQKYLGSYQEQVEVLHDVENVKDYISGATAAGIIALDTETTGLDVLSVDIIGTCLYVPGKKAVYIPHNHLSYVSGERLSGQLTMEELKECLEPLKELKVVMHNAKYDVRVLTNQANITLPCYWDSMLAARLINENERAALKEQYAVHFEGHKKEYDFDSLFGGVDQRYVPVDLFALYAAVDALKTYELYEYQKDILERPENKRVYDVFMNIEMALLPAICATEDRGIRLDCDFAKELSVKYHLMMDECNKKVMEELNKYAQPIKQYRLTHPVNKLSDPIAVTSPTQLAVLLYDIIKTAPVDKAKPRGTGEDILKKIGLPLCDAILEYRGLAKLLTTYIDKLPNTVHPKDGRIHASFNQVGADTGRLSSSDPNLQNIPSHNKEIRKMFVASPGYVLVGSDFSQQEPRLLAHFSGDEHMIEAYNNKRDMYATVASKIYRVPYDQCLEFAPDGSEQPEGKKRRTFCKSIVLGLMYGRGANSIAEQINSTPEEAQSIIDGFYDGFPTVRKWMDKTKAEAKRVGYVETLWGRRRHLPDIQLPYYSAKLMDSSIPDDFNPFFSADIKISASSGDKCQRYVNELNACRSFRDKEDIKKRAYNDGVKIEDNGGFISTAERQSVNSRIQGSAGDMTKRAMISIYNNPRMKELDFHMLITVHDEIIGECPIENASEAGELLSQLMINAAKPECTVAMKCDVDYSLAWYDYSLDYFEEFVEDFKNGCAKESCWYNKKWRKAHEKETA